MRMDRRQAFSAVDVVNDYSFPQLARVIETYGEERFARRITRAIVDARPIRDTGHLAEVVRPPSPRRPDATAAIRPSAPSRPSASRSTAQLDQLAEALDGAMAVPLPRRPHGRHVVPLLEDRMVKQTPARRRDRRVHVSARAALRVRRRTDGPPPQARSVEGRRGRGRPQPSGRERAGAGR